MKVAASLVPFLLLGHPRKAWASSLRGLNADVEQDSGVIYPHRRQLCTVDSDCPQVQCIRAPCDFFACQGGRCIFIYDRNDDPDGSVVDTGVACGPKTCPEGQVCCNESCGICTPPNTVCSPMKCLDPDNHINGQTQEMCGPVTCAVGEICCNKSCGICIKPGDSCTEQFCLDGDDRNDGDGDGSTIDTGVACGPVQCPEGQVCCNESCGICTPPNGKCHMMLCSDNNNINPPEGDECGAVTCDVGEVCCNDSCGICTQPGEFCTMQLCNNDPDDEGSSSEEGGFQNFWEFITQERDCNCHSSCSACGNFLGVCVRVNCPD